MKLALQLGIHSSKYSFAIAERLVGRLGLGLGKLAVVALVKRDAVAGDIDEEEAAMGQAIVHFVKRVDDEVDRGPQSPRDRELAVQPLLGLAPNIRPGRSASCR